MVLRGKNEMSLYEYEGSQGETWFDNNTVQCCGFTQVHYNMWWNPCQKTTCCQAIELLASGLGPNDVRGSSPTLLQWFVHTQPQEEPGVACDVARAETQHPDLRLISLNCSIQTSRGLTLLQLYCHFAGQIVI